MILAGKGWELATYLIARVLYLLFKVYLVLQVRIFLIFYKNEIDIQCNISD